MKTFYLFVTAVVALTAYVFLITAAAGVEVTSNIVGHHQIELESGRNFVGLNFKNPDADKTAYDVQDLLDTSALKGGETAHESDRMFLWDPAAQAYIQLWLLDSGGDFPDLDGKWWDPEAGAVAEQEVYPGDGFFLIVEDAANMVLSGEVQDDLESFTHAALDGRSLIASAWPIDIEVNEMKLDGLKGGETAHESDRLFLWDVKEQKYIQLWLLDSGGDFPELDGKWWDPEANALAEQEFSAGSAAFIIKRTVDALTEEKPY